MSLIVVRLPLSSIKQVMLLCALIIDPVTASPSSSERDEPRPPVRAGICPFTSVGPEDAYFFDPKAAARALREMRNKTPPQKPAAPKAADKWRDLLCLFGE